jgi:hypothetical protein
VKEKRVLKKPLHMNEEDVQRSAPIGVQSNLQYSKETTIKNLLTSLDSWEVVGVAFEELKMLTIFL